jgi:hypothetical protein
MLGPIGAGMSVPISSIAVGKCYSRFSEVRRVTKITGDSVAYIAHNQASGGGTATAVTTQPLARFAQEVDGQVPCPPER